MQLDTVLDVIIGLSFTYFLLASMVSFAQEKIANFFSWRGTYLVKAIDVILDNRPGVGFTWDGPAAWRIAHFSRGVPDSTIVDAGANGPRPLPPGVAAQPANTVSVAAIAQVVSSHPLLCNGANDLPSYTTGANFATALLYALRDGSQNPMLQQAGTTVNALPDGDLKTILSGFISMAGNDVEKLHASIEAWFDTEMDWLSGIYKRSAQYASLIIGAALTLVLNVDSIHLLRYLWIDAPVQRASSSPTAPDFAGSIQTALQTYQGLSLPIGWTAVPDLSATIGLAITIAAVSLGAPFWFDLVQNITNLRSGGQKTNSAK